MRRRIISLLLAVLIIFSTVPVVYAHPTQNEHDDDLMELLFGEGYFLTGERKRTFQAIADAAALCIDQFSSNENLRRKEELFKSLDDREGFSFSFDDIDLVKGSDGQYVSARTHRRYTHRGWDFNEYPLKELWERRKKILTATVNNELFGKSPGILKSVPWLEKMAHSEKACNEECENFCKLIYYIHILGDYEEAKTYTPEVMQLIPLTRHEDSTAPALIDELIEINETLFKNEASNNSVKEKLKSVKEKCEQLPFSRNAEWTQAQFDEYHQYALDLKNIIKENVPLMLSHKDFFKNVFK